jgi:ubiquinone/menaquinone biosynthesis C-methylase UbiE
MLVRGDASRLPLADRSVDCVACSLALMVLTPLERAADEVARVTRPGGTLALLLPASRPVSTLDRVRYARLAVALRCRPVRFPHPAALRDLHRILEARGYRVASDEQLRFSYPVVDEAAADAIVTSFYLPGIPEPRRTVARGIARRWIGTDLGVPLRRVSAVDDR